MNITNIPVYTVSQVNSYVKSLMDEDDLLTGLLVRGEISNYKCYPSGHVSYKHLTLPTILLL